MRPNRLPSTGAWVPTTHTSTVALRAPRGPITIRMLKTSLLRLSESPAAKRLITRAPVSRSLAERFVAGDTLHDASQPRAR
jgi:hypothetical protein